MEDVMYETKTKKRKSLSGRLAAWVARNVDRPIVWLVAGFGSFAESVFSLIPPEVFLVPMVAAKPKSWMKFSIFVGMSTVVGGVVGYGLGLFLYDPVVVPIIDFYGIQDEFARVGGMYEKNAVWAIVIGGLTPFPYKVISLTAGAFGVNFVLFTVVSFLTRMFRYLLVGWLVSHGMSLGTLAKKIFRKRKLPWRKSKVKDEDLGVSEVEEGGDDGEERKEENTQN